MRSSACCAKRSTSLPSQPDSSTSATITAISRTAMPMLASCTCVTACRIATTRPVTVAIATIGSDSSSTSISA
jgi:hypothetical protein